MSVPIFPLIGKRIEEVTDYSIEEIATVTTENAKQLFGL